MVLPDCCKEYLTVTKCKTSVLLWTNDLTVWYMDRLSASSYTRVTNCQIWSSFLWLELQDISLTPDKELNVLIYWTLSYVIIYRSYTLSKMVRFLAHPVHTSIQFKCINHVNLKLDESSNTSRSKAFAASFMNSVRTDQVKDFDNELHVFPRHRCLENS